MRLAAPSLHYITDLHNTIGVVWWLININNKWHYKLFPSTQSSQSISYQTFQKKMNQREKMSNLPPHHHSPGGVKFSLVKNIPTAESQHCEISPKVSDSKYIYRVKSQNKNLSFIKEITNGSYLTLVDEWITIRSSSSDVQEDGWSVNV